MRTAAALLHLALALFVCGFGLAAATGTPAAIATIALLVALAAIAARTERTAHSRAGRRIRRA